MTTSENTSSFVGRTFTDSTYPTTPRAFYLVSIQTVLGPEGEGLPGQLIDTGEIKLAMNIGTVVPPIGSYVVVSLVRFKWVFRYSG